jgi:hypothetical protein
VEDMDEKNAALNIIMNKYSSENSFHYSDKALREVTVIKININTLTGKKSGY